MKVSNATIGVRLGAFAALFSLALIGVGAEGWHLLSASNDRQDEAAHRAILLENSVDLARSAQVNFKIQVQDWKDILLRGRDQGAFNDYLKGFNQQHDLTQANLQKLNDELNLLGLDNNLVLVAQRTHADLKPKYLDALKKFDPAKPDSLYQIDAEVRGIDRAPTEQFDDIVSSVLRQSELMRKASNDAARAAYRTASLWSLLIVTIALAFGIMATMRLVRSIRRQLLATLNLVQAVADGTSERLAVVTAISDGNLDQEFAIKPLPQIDMSKISSDEIGDTVHTVVAMGELQTALDGAFMKMSTSLRHSRDVQHENDWFKTGQNELNNLMQGEQGATDVANKVLFYLVDRLGAGVGVFYLYDEQSSQFYLTSRYAMSQERNPAGTVLLGDGLIGQAVREGKTIHVTDVPAGYLPITAAWGSAPTCSVIVIPLLHGMNVIGAMELGAFKPFLERELAFIEQIRESVAIGFEVNLSRQRTISLLEETNQQAEELRVQQEELQQTNEELEERAEMLEQQREQIRAKNRELELAGDEMRRRSQELTMVSAYKSEFMANMSHELRTPLNSMLILSGLLKENKAKNLSEKQVEYAATINNAGKDLLSLINDILDLSKVEAGQIEFNYEDVATKEICDAMAMLFAAPAEQKSLMFKRELSSEMSATIRIDQQRVQQILKNLIGNSLKFTEAGEIALRIYLALPSQNPLGMPAIAFAVSDTGIGVSADKQSLIFDAFKQADGGISRKFGGTGLGLSISRQLARKMGGDIALASKEGQGSTFTLYLPVTPQSSQGNADKTPLASAVPLAALASEVRALPHAATYYPTDLPVALPDDRAQLKPNTPCILIIEDDSNFAKILMDFVHERGFEALVATDGEAGIAMAKRFAPSAILLDVMLPKVDGWGVMASLKENVDTTHIPVHFITCMEGKERAIGMGAIGFISKPVSQEQLTDAFQTIEAALAVSNKRLLIVEDNVEQVKSLQALLSEKDLTITVATSGKEAIEILRNGRFDCMILDLGLADMTGFDLLEHLQTMEQARQTPVIIHSGKDLTREQERELHRYTENIIVKGTKSAERLLNEVTLFLHMVENRLEQPVQEILRSPSVVDADLKGKKILLVDDDMRNIFSLTSLLDDAGLVVVEAENGIEALAKLAADKDIDMVLMDIMMPEMDGYEAMRRIRSEPRYKGLPIIAMTAKAMQEDRQKCLDAGANDYLSKPIDTQKLMSMLRVWTDGFHR